MTNTPIKMHDTAAARRFVGAAGHPAVLLAQWSVEILAATAIRLRARFDAWRRRRETLGRLLALDDRMLADIGLTRYDVEAMANGRIPSHADDIAEIVAFPVRAGTQRLAGSLTRAA